MTQQITKPSGVNMLANMKVSLSGLLLTGLVSLCVSGAGLYANWINGAINDTKAKVEQLTFKALDSDHNLDIVNSKIDILLADRGLTYQGPKFKAQDSLPGSQKQQQLQNH